MAGESRKSFRGEFEVGEPVVKMTGELTLGLATLMAGLSASRVLNTGAVSCPVTLKIALVFHPFTSCPYLAIMMVVRVSGLSVACCSIRACNRGVTTG